MQMLKFDMLEVEVGSNQATKALGKSTNTKCPPRNYTCTALKILFSVRSLSAAAISDTSDGSREKKHAEIRNWIDA